jgi:acetyl-CoA acetyltransferase
MIGEALSEAIRGEVSIVGIGETAYTGASGRSPEAMGLEAVGAALADAGLEPSRVDGLMITGHYPHQVTPASFREHFGVRQDIWFSGEGGAMTYAATAPCHAAAAIRQGLARIVVNVFAIDWATQMLRGTHGGPAGYHLDEPMKANAEVPFGFIPQPVYFAHMARRHMIDFGTTADQLGAIAVAQRRHANGHPGAVMREKPLSLDDYLRREPFVDPLRLEDCCLISDGAAAFVVTAADHAADLAAAPVDVLGVGYGRSIAGPHFAQEPDFTSTPQCIGAPAAFAMAGVTPADVDVLANYDPFTIASLMQIEDMGFCPKGEGGRFVAGDRLAFDRGRRRGGLPYNTHGGLLSHAYMLGIAHVVELVRQLRGRAANQVEDAEIGVYGGYTGLDAATMVLAKR